MARKAKKAGSQIKVAMILLRSNTFPTPQAFTDELTARWPELELKLVKSEDELLMFTAPDFLASLCMFPIPIPKGEFDKILPATWHWPEAKEAVKSHCAHLMVVLSQFAGTPMDMAVRLTKVTDCALALTDALGVYWVDGPVLTAEDAFQEMADRLHEDSLPLPSWIGFYFAKTAPNGLTGTTSGLEQFDRREIEVDHLKGKANLLEFITTLAHYVLTSGREIYDGDRVDDDKRTLRVFYRPSRYDPNRTAMVLQRTIDIVPPTRRVPVKH